MALYIEVEYRGDWWGEDPLHETDHETPGELFRALAGKDSRYPWEALGRCTGKVYVDVPGSPCTLCDLPRAEHYGPVGTTWIEPNAKHPHGAIVSHGHCYQADARQVGWVFVARNPPPVNRGDEQPTGLRESWVTVYSAPPTVVRTEHYAEFPR